MQSKQKQIFKSKKFWFVTISVIFALILGAGLVFSILASSKSGSPQLSLQTPIDEDSSTSSAWSGGTAPFTHGTGTENDPYLVESAENLAYISVNYDNSNIKGKYFKQTVNIDLNNVVWTPINQKTEDDSLYYFYDGNNCKISHLYINSSDSESCFGLFGWLHGGYIKNLTIQDGSISYTGTNGWPDAAAFVGTARGAASRPILIENCHNKNTFVSCYMNAGGIVGYSSANRYLTFKKCTNSGTVTVNTNGGGIIGKSRSEGAIENCSNTGVVSGYKQIGGFVGFIDGGNLDILNCYNEAQLTCTEDSIGGVIGRASANSCNIINCYNTGKIYSDSGDTSADAAGGIVGWASYGPLDIINCHNRANLETDKYNVGGLIGGCSSDQACVVTISNSYNAGSVDGRYRVAGLVGVANKTTTITNCHNNGYVTGTSDYVGGLIGRLYGSNATIVNCYNTGIVSGAGNYVGGLIGGTSSTVIIKNCYNAGDVSGVTGIGGILGSCSYNTTVDNCYNVGSVTDSGYYAGGIVGSGGGNDLIITNCFNTAEVVDVVNASGGIVGYATAKQFRIEKCYNTGYIHASGNAAAGIVGDIRQSCEAFIISCYNLGDIKLAYNCGGIVGTMYSSDTITISSCFNISDVVGSGGGGGIISYTDTGEKLIISHCYCSNTNLGFAVYGQNITTGCTSNMAAADMKCGDGIKPTNFSDSYTVADWLFVSGEYPTFRKTVAIPEITNEFTYCGREIAPVICYDSNYITLSSTTVKATNAGTYSFTLTLKNTTTSVWEDGTTAAKTLTWEIERATIDESILPSQSGTLTYNGSARNVTWTSYDTSKIAVGGATSGVNAGTYKATFTPTANYKWSDGSTTARTVEWTIGKATLANPSLSQANNEFAFTANTINATNYLVGDTSKFTVEGATQAIRAGTYVFVVYIKNEYKNNYVFANGRDFATITWTILPYDISNATIVIS